MNGEIVMLNLVALRAAVFTISGKTSGEGGGTDIRPPPPSVRGLIQFKRSLGCSRSHLACRLASPPSEKLSMYSNGRSETRFERERAVFEPSATDSLSKFIHPMSAQGHDTKALCQWGYN